MPPQAIGTPVAMAKAMFGLIRRFVIGWLLVKLFKRVAAGGRRDRRT